MAYQKGNLRVLATDVASQTYHRSPNHKVAEITVWSYVTDDSLAVVTAGDYYYRAHDQLSEYDLVFFMAEGGWGILRIEDVDTTLGTVSFSQLAGGGGGGGAVSSVAGNIGNVTAGQLITAIDAIPDVNFLTDAERAAITSGATGTLPTVNKGDIIVHNGATNVALPVGLEGTIRIADSTTATGFRDIAPVVNVLDAAARDVAGPLFTGQHLVVADDNGNGDSQTYLITLGGSNFANSNKVALQGDIADSPTITIPAQNIAAGGAFASNPIAFTGAVSTDAFVAAAPTDIGASPNFAQATVNYQSDGFVRLVVKNSSTGVFNLPAQDWKIYKVNQSQGSSGSGSAAPVSTNVVPTANGAAATLGRLNELDDGATMTVPSAAANTDAIFSAMLTTGGTAATIGAPINQALTDPLDVFSYRSDGTIWERIGAANDPDFFSIVQVANGGEVQLGRVNEIADGATVNIPAPSATNINQTFAVFLTEGGSLANLGAPLSRAISQPFVQLNFRSDGVSWDEYGADTSAGGAGIPTGNNGSIPVQSGGAYTAQQLFHTTGHHFVGAGNGEVLRIPITLPFDVDSVGVSVSAGSADFTASIDNGPGTPSTNITGIVNIAANTLALTSASASGASAGTANQYLVVTLSNASSVNGFIQSRYQWTGA